MAPSSGECLPCQLCAWGWWHWGHQAWPRDLLPASHEKVPPRGYVSGPLGLSRGLSLQAEAGHGASLPSDSPCERRGPRPHGACRPSLPCALRRSALPTPGFFHPASCPTRLPWVPCLTPAYPGPKGTAGCSPASVCPRCLGGADPPPIGDIKGKQEAVGPAVPPRAGGVSVAAWGPAAGDFPSAGFPQDTPAPASALRSRWSWVGGSRAFPGAPAGPVLSLPATCWRV